MNDIANEVTSIRASVNAYLPNLVDIDAVLNLVKQDTDGIRLQTTSVASSALVISDHVSLINDQLNDVVMELVALRGDLGYGVSLATLAQDLGTAVGLLGDVAATAASMESDTAAMRLSVDGLEGLVTTSNSLLSSAGALINTGNGRLQTIISLVDGVEAGISSLLAAGGFGSSSTLYNELLAIRASLDAIDFGPLANSMAELVGLAEIMVDRLISIASSGQAMVDAFGYSAAERTFESDMSAVLALLSAQGETWSLDADPVPGFTEPAVMDEVDFAVQYDYERLTREHTMGQSTLDDFVGRLASWSGEAPVIHWEVPQVTLPGTQTSFGPYSWNLDLGDVPNLSLILDVLKQVTLTIAGTVMIQMLWKEIRP